MAMIGANGHELTVADTAPLDERTGMGRLRGVIRSGCSAAIETRHRTAKWARRDLRRGRRIGSRENACGRQLICITCIGEPAMAEQESGPSSLRTQASSGGSRTSSRNANTHATKRLPHCSPGLDGHAHHIIWQS
jgi:hypothetical protein